jgi:hypothetical protein
MVCRIPPVRLFVLVVLAGCAGPVPPHLSAIEDRIFAPNCTFSSCHSAFGQAAHLVLVRGRSRASLVDQPSDKPEALEEGLLRVKPGDPDHSFLVMKLRDPLAAKYGDRMPQHQAPLENSDLAAITEWIRLGAKDD